MCASNKEICSDANEERLHQNLLFW